MENREFEEVTGIYRIILFMLICFDWLAIITLILGLNENAQLSYISASIACIVLLTLSSIVILWQFWYIYRKMNYH